MDDRAWFVPSVILTVALGLVAWAMMPVAGFHSVPPYFSAFLNWMGAATAGAALILIARFIGLVVSKVPQPSAALLGELKEHARALSFVAAGVTLAGIDMLFFMWIKPELAAVSPFWVDPYLAELDYIVFGTDPWRYFQGISLESTAWVYNFIWPASILVTLLWIFAQPQSTQRSNSILSYFAIWSIFGPIGQFAFSGAGPIFYSRIGLGDRFAEMHSNIPWITNRIADYLWGQYSNNELGLAAGISAMPSLHVATVTWIVLSMWDHKSRATPVALLFAIYIWGASVALGWHYASDGLAGVIGALVCHRLSRRYVEQYRAGALGSVELA
jgi:hypothetical protein